MHCSTPQMSATRGKCERRLCRCCYAPAAQLRRARPNPLNGLTVKPRKAFTDAREAGPHRLGETRLCRAVSAQHNSKLLGEMTTLHRFKDLPAPTHHAHERSVSLSARDLPLHGALPYCAESSGSRKPTRAARPDHRTISPGATATAPRWDAQLLPPRRRLSGVDSVSGQYAV
jgi:hypothetical protein